MTSALTSLKPAPQTEENTDFKYYYLFFFYSLSSFMFVQNTLIGMKGKIMAFFKTQPVQSIIHETRPLFLREKKSIQK